MKDCKLSPLLPIHVRALDHYTLICEDAKKIADFHTKVLHFKFLRIQSINTGTVRQGEVDMVNYILQPPGNPNVTLVITEGLNDETIFRKYMKQFGRGVHHVAFQVDNVDEAFHTIKRYGYTTTSDMVMKDKLSGLKQFFLDPSNAGFFIELIERPSKISPSKANSCEASQNGFFTENNMSGLARSIGSYIKESTHSQDADKSFPEAIGCTAAADGQTDLESAMKAITVGPIKSVGIAVESPNKSVSFLTEVLGFRLVNVCDEAGNMKHLSIPGQNDEFTLNIYQAKTKDMQRQVTVCFSVDELHRINDTFAKKINPNGNYRLHLPAFHATYNVELAAPSDTSSAAQIVKSDGLNLHVHIWESKQAVLEYLLMPSNLPQWTGHRAVHFSKTIGHWVETRIDEHGLMVDVVLIVEQTDPSTVKIEWPGRKLRVSFECFDITKNSCSLTARLPKNLCEGNLARLKKILSIELDILKSRLEKNTDFCIPDYFWRHVQAYHLNMYGYQIKKHFSDEMFGQECPFKGEIVHGGDLKELMSTDFALSVYSKPLAILRPVDVADVVSAVKVSAVADVKIAARGSLVSHSAGGQAQSHHGLVMDMTGLCKIELLDGNCAVRVQAGTSWHELIQKTLEQGMIPPVINDYQFLSVGGTISMGGVGFMSHCYGLQASHVRELQVVTGNGDIVYCTKNLNKDLFDHCRAGLGQFGVITEVTIPLMPAPKKISITVLFYEEDAMTDFASDVQELVQGSSYEMIHAFIKPCSRSTISKIIGPKKFEASKPEFRQAIDEGEKNGKLVFYLEVARYLQDVEEFEGGTSKLSTLKCIAGEYFEETLDFFDYVTKDPPVIEINKAVGKVPHPSMVITIEKDNGMEVLRQHIESKDRGNDSFNEILLIPIKPCTAQQDGVHVPMFPMPEVDSTSNIAFFMLFLGSAIPNTQANIDKVRKHHFQLYEYAISLGGKRYSYDTVTADVKGEAQWKKHYGDEVWHKICIAKRKYDPHHMLCPGIPIWE